MSPVLSTESVSDAAMTLKLSRSGAGQHPMVGPDPFKGHQGRWALKVRGSKVPGFDVL